MIPEKNGFDTWRAVRQHHAGSVRHTFIPMTDNLRAELEAFGRIIVGCKKPSNSTGIMAHYVSGSGIAFE